MRERPSAQLYALAGSPPQERVVEHHDPVRCRVCASRILRAAPYERWQGANFTDQNKLRCTAAENVCEPCIWAHAWNPPPGHPAPAPGKKGVNLRLFSHLLDGRGYIYANKAEKPAIRKWLFAPKRGEWWAAIADSGQKHIVPWATVNRDPHVGVVRFEERDVFIDSRSGACVATCDLLTAGATKAEVETGDYRPETWRRCELVVRAYEGRYGRERGSGWFALTLWLAQRDEDAVAARRATEKEAKDGRRTARQGDRPGCRSANGGAGGVPPRRSERTQALAADPRPCADGDEDEREDQRMADSADARAPVGGSGQLSLFGDAGPVRGGRRG